MVTNVFIECNNCKTKYRLRWQVEEGKTALLIRCPKCNSKIRGSFEAKNLKLDASLINATEINEDSAEYVQELSLFFLTHKLTPVKKFADLCTPFIRNSGNDYSKHMRYFDFIENHPNEAETVYDLLMANSTRYLKEKLRDENNYYISLCKSKIKKYVLNSKVDLLMATHQYIMVSLLSSGLNIDTDYIMRNVTDLEKSSSSQIKEFAKLMDNNGYFDRINEKYVKLVNMYNDNYLSLVPVFVLRMSDPVNLKEFGLSSVDYEDLLELYSKCYEFIGEFIIYVIGLNNIASRGGMNEFSKGTADIEEKVNKEDKYNRVVSFVKEKEMFSLNICDVLNNIIRNADAHFDVEYDIFTQKIKFTNKKNSKTEEMYLVELANETIKMFELASILWEIAYQLQKNRMIFDLNYDCGYGR